MLRLKKEKNCGIILLITENRRRIMADFRWFKVDTAAIMFSSLSDKRWGRTFRFSAYFKEEIDPVALKKAVKDLMPYYPSIYAYLKRGFFWNYLVSTEKMPEISEENEFGMKPIVLRTDGTPDFRITYKRNRINIDCSHSLGDGKGIIIYFKALLTRYNELRKGDTGDYATCEDPSLNIRDSFSDYYRKGEEKATDKSKKAFHFPEEYEEGVTRLLFAKMSTAKVKELAHKEKMTVTEYLTAILILGIIKSQKNPIFEPITIATPVNLRRFFPTMTLRNFTVQTFVTFEPRGRQDVTLREILDATRGQLKAQLKKEELQKTINKYGALVNNPVIRIVPGFIKQPVMRAMQKNTHAGVTTIFTNYGACNLPDALSPDIERLQFVNGDTRRYGLAVTCSCIGFGDVLSLCFSRANLDTSWYDTCVQILENEGISVTTDRIDGFAENAEKNTVKEKLPLSAERIKAYFNL